MDNNIKELEKELKYLTQKAIKEEIEKNKVKLEIKDLDAKDLANKIYLERGIDVSKLHRNITGNLINELGMLFTGFKNKDSKIKRKMIIDIIYMVLIIILFKIPFDLVRDIGYEYIEMLSTNNVLYTLWHLAFLLLYTISMICTLIALIKNFNNKYNKE